MALAGKEVELDVSDDGGSSWSTVEEMNDWSFDVAGDNIDVSVFETDWVKRIQGLRDGTWDLSGFLVAGATGQNKVLNALLNDTQLKIRVLYNGTNGFSQDVKVATFSLSASADSSQDLSISLEGDGAVAIIP